MAARVELSEIVDTGGSTAITAAAAWVNNVDAMYRRWNSGWTNNKASSRGVVRDREADYLRVSRLRQIAYSAVLCHRASKRFNVGSIAAAHIPYPFSVG